MSWLLLPSAETSSHSSNSVSMPLSFCACFKGCCYATPFDIKNIEHASYAEAQ